MSESDIVRRLKEDLKEAKKESQVFEVFMHEYYSLKEGVDELLLFLHHRLGKMGVSDCDACLGTGGIKLGEDDEGVTSWSHPVSDPCEDCFGVGKDTMAAMYEYHERGRRRKKNKDRFKGSTMRLVED